MGAKTKAGLPKREHEELNACRGTIPIATAGEVFPDGAMIELVRDVAEPERAALLLWDGAKETIGPLVEYKGRFYEPVPLNRSLLRELTLPTHSCPCGSARELLWESCKLVKDFIGLPDKLVGLVGRLVLVSGIVGALPVAPALAITGPDVVPGKSAASVIALPLPAFAANGRGDSRRALLFANWARIHSPDQPTHDKRQAPQAA